jgi:2-methylcitrate dehydratase PrpD
MALAYPAPPSSSTRLKAAFDFGAMIRWLDYNDTWLRLSGGIHLTILRHSHDSRLLSASTAVTLHKTLTIHEILVAMIKDMKYRVFSRWKQFQPAWLDHVLLVRVATTAVIAGLPGCTREEIINAVSNAFVDGGALRTTDIHPTPVRVNRGCR